MSQEESKKHVVVIGGGFGGLNAVKSLNRYRNIRITLIDRTNHHLFQPLLYQVATAALSPGDIAMPIREIFRKKANVSTLLGTVLLINKEDKNLVLENGQKIAFDSLIISCGNRHAYFGHPQWEAYAPGLKTLQDALQIREKILSSFEIAERLEDPREQVKYMTFVIIGGGPTGIEMAGAIAEIAHQSLKKNFRKIDPSLSKIMLIEGGEQILTGYPIRFATKAMHDLEKMHVTIKLNSRVTQINDEGVYIQDQFIEAKNVIWAAGNEASPLLKSLGVEQDKQNRVIVQPDLSIRDFPDIFVIGDAAHCKDKSGNPLAAVAPVAVQQGRYVGKLIGKNVIPSKREPFQYVDKGMMATIGKYKALVLSGPFRCTGFIAWLAWSFVHIYFLIGYRTKLFVFSQWAFYFFHGQRNVRLIVRPLLDRSKNED